MKIFTDRKGLKKKLAVLGKALSKESEGYGGYITVKAEEDGLYAYSSDGSLTIKAKLESFVKFDKGENANDVRFSVDGKLFMNAVGRDTNDDNIELSWLDGRNALTIGFKSGEIKLPTTSAKGYALSDTESDKKSVMRISGDDFFAIKAQVVPFVNPGTTNPSLKGVNLRIKNGKLIAEGSDGYKIARVALNPVSVVGWESLNASIPVATFEAISELVGNAEAIEVHETKYGLQVAYDDVVIAARAYAAKSIDFDKFIPTSFDISFEVNKKEIEEAVARTLLFNNLVVAKLSYDNGILNVSCATDSGESVSSIAGNANRGISAREMCFNPKYLALAVKASAGETIRFNWTERACVIADGNAEFMILPIRNI